MTRRSFFVFAAVFMMILMAFSFALADNQTAYSVVINKDTAGSICVGLDGYSAAFPNKIEGEYSRTDGWDEFTFTIIKPIEEADWKLSPKEFDLRIRIKAPAGNIGCTVKEGPGNGYYTDLEAGGYLCVSRAVRPDTLTGSRSYNFELVWSNG